MGDSKGGIVWRITPDGAADEWASGPLLQGAPVGGTEGEEYGANGPVVHEGTLYVTNTEQGSVVRIPINADGSAGEATIAAQDEQLLGADGLVFDRRGSMYVTTSVMNHSLARVQATTGVVETIADSSDGLNYPACLSFGQGPLDSDTDYIANTGSTDPLFPAVLAADVNVPGIPG